MTPGTIIRLPDGREGTVVYHGLDGYGIRWGRIEVDAEAILAGNACVGRPPDRYRWFPEAMLRNPYPGADLPCVGEDYEVVEVEARTDARAGGTLVAESVFDEAKRRRIIAAVNACAGIPTALLEEGLIGKLLAGDRAVADNHNDPACPCPSCRLVRRLDEGDES